jgi:multidrug efflux pump subunit AcrA (membrane-fusion protein)
MAIVGGLALFFIILAIFHDGADEVIEDSNDAKKVTTQVLSVQDEVTSKLTTSGTIVPQEYSIIRGLTPGTVQFLVPVGERVERGQSLFSLADSNIENNYFNSLTSFNQTESLTEQRVLQAELALSSAEARLEVARKNFETTKLQTQENLSSAESTAINSYNSAYNTLKHALIPLSTGALENNFTQYRFRNVLGNNFQLRELAITQFDIARNLFIPLSPTASPSVLGDQMNGLLSALEAGKVLLDTTSLLLQGAVGSDLAISISQTTQNQTLVNNAVSSVIGAQNSLASTDIQNGLLFIRAENDLTLAELDRTNAEIGLDNAKKSATIEATASQSQLDNASYNFSNLNMPSPFSGTIISHFVTLGEQVTVGQQLVEIGNLDLVEVIADIDVEFSDAIALGDKVSINKTYEGIISEIEPAGDINSGKVRITVTRDNFDNALKAGGVADLTFALSFSDEKRLVVPIKSTTIEETESCCFFLE